MDYTKNSQIDKLVELKQLYEQGILTKEELETEKQKILGTAPETPKPESPKTIGQQSADEVKQTVENSTIDTGKPFFKNNKSYIIGGLGVIIIGLLLLSFHNKIETSVIEDSNDVVEIDSLLSTNKYTKVINLKELFEAIHDTNSSKLKTILNNNGFVFDSKGDEYTSTIWKKVVYNSERTESDTIFVFLTSLTGFVGQEVDLVITCKEDDIMNEWVTNIKELGYSIAEEIKEEKYICLSFSKKNDKGGLIKYDSPSREKTIEILTNFNPNDEGLGEDPETNETDNSDNTYDYRFVGSIQGKNDKYPFKMNLNIDGVGHASGYYIITNRDNKRVQLKGVLTNWAEGKGDIKLLEYDEAKKDYTGYSFHGVLRLEETDQGKYAGYSMSGAYKNNDDIDWQFTAKWR